MLHEHDHRELEDDRSAAERSAMVHQQLRSISDARVIAAMGRVPRHLFVPPELRHAAYHDTPLPIGHGQTISQPLMVAIMLEAMELRGRERVLEVGAGCGYQAALLGELAAEVHAIEIVPPLARMAARNLRRLGYRNVTVLEGDGSLGHAAAAPYDAIVVAAAASAVPQALVDQLAPGGRLLVPLGQVLERLRKLPDGRVTIEHLGGCAFVPLVGAYAH
jgi:protein-L-isoaspartate(D-aspartate) O-methyltransferase